MNPTVRLLETTNDRKVSQKSEKMNGFLKLVLVDCSYFSEKLYSAGEFSLKFKADLSAFAGVEGFHQFS